MYRTNLHKRVNLTKTKCSNPHILSHASPKNTDMQGLSIENSDYCVGCPERGRGCYLTQQTLPMCLTTTQLDPCCCISVFLMRHPHVSNVNLISEVTSWGVFKNLLQNFYTGVGFGDLCRLHITQLFYFMRALIY